VATEESDFRLTRWETGRVEAFSDGVLAIAITLLVLEIHVDDYGHLWRELAHQWPSYLAYVTSFLTVGSVWIAHHGLFVRLRYIDPVLLRLNLLLLMAAAFLPFPTGVLAEALDASRSAERAAVVFYGGTALVIELLLRACVRYASAHPALVFGGPDARPEPPIARGWRAVAGTALYALLILIGIFLVPRLAAFGYLAVALIGVLVHGSEGRLGLGALFGRHPR
jgi:uncharacterized membrane protein